MRKKYWWVALTVAVIVLIGSVGFINTNKTVKTISNNSENGFAVIELFTSEGCSSCPPAEEVVARLVAKNLANVYVLAYHVDYWDRLGWKDHFSQAAFSQRQNQYAAAFNLGSVYTPQVIVNGSSEFVGSDEGKLIAAVEKSLPGKPAAHISISPVKSDQIITVEYNIDAKDAVLLNLALVQAEAATSVKNGENSGRTLHHLNVVRGLKTIEAKGKGTVIIDIPGELKNIPLQIIAYTQAKKDLHVLAAEQKAL